ncbi:MAG: UDP-N-acetylmuramoyl-L-alanyl-D-glutamate--2,6-diaminopimelate ligase [Candidatus Puniceispirillum sp.]|nr:UDP-N-acetylmuramoyl-L-alanyl-D-glutamate--2,6-diaminopimelate ligase [Candidatus Puniceispirillum sp.]
MHLKELLPLLSDTPLPHLESVPVSGIKDHSAHVKPGDLFLALPSLSGKDIAGNIEEALTNGAAAVILSHPHWDHFKTAHPEAPFIPTKDPRLARAKIAAHIFPHQPKHLVAVTGTNGKTSTVHFFRQICEMAGKKAASIGTLGVQSADAWSKDMTQGMTCPDPFTLHKCLDHLAKDGTDYVALEASSHGLHQRRLDGADFEAAAFTNLSHEHLDYHGTLQEYFEAKKRLFSDLLVDGMTAILNADDAHAQELLRLCNKRQDRVLTYGKGGKDVRLVELVLQEHGQLLTLEIFGRLCKINLPLVGTFQASNVLCAASLACAVGISYDAVIEALPKLKNVPGRLQYVGHTHKGGHVYVDYAHTPHALESVLTSIRPHVKGPVVVVFGCGGDRDKQKRRLMGEVAHLHADQVIVTDDNPRTEDPKVIRASILAGCPGAISIADRRQAIETALKGLGEHGVCVIAGKGHEQGQLVNGDVIPFDDVAVAKELLTGLKGTPA